MPGDQQIPLSETVEHIAKMYAKGAAWPQLYSIDALFYSLVIHNEPSRSMQ